MISLKKYLDMDPNQKEPNKNGESDHPESAMNDLSSVLLESYRAALLAMGNSGVRACPSSGSGLQHALARLERALFAKITVPLVKETQTKVEEQLHQWDARTAEYFQAKANEVKELLIVLAGTAEAMAKRDTRYASHFHNLTAQLHSIADLDDLTQVRTSLVRQAAELETYIEKMTQDSRDSVAQLKAEVVTYESRLKAVEQLVEEDALTRICNRRGIEDRIQQRIARSETFCVVVLDLNHFKAVNDTHGHLVGDELLRQFADELRTNVRSTDRAGRWGGDEFIVLLDGNLEMANTQIDRVRRWVFGEYTLQLDKDSAALKLKVEASIGLAQWGPGESIAQLIARADASMYQEKKANAQRAGK